MSSKTAKDLADAIGSGAKVKSLAAAVMQEIAPATSGVLDIGVGRVLAIRPGYGPLKDIVEPGKKNDPAVVKVINDITLMLVGGLLGWIGRGKD